MALGGLWLRRAVIGGRNIGALITSTAWPLGLMEANRKSCRTARKAQPTDGCEIQQIGPNFSWVQMPRLRQLAATQLNRGSASSTELQVPEERGHTQRTTGTTRPRAPSIELLQGPVGEINGLSADGIKAHGRCRNACPW
jgi:hypothetical protein